MGDEKRDRAGFLGWAERSVTPLATVVPGENSGDLASLGKMIGNATVVAIGEGDHFGAEPMLFRNRIFQYLVQEKGFTAIAIESGIVESRVVHDYVRGGAGDLFDVVSQGISWTFDQLPQNEALVRWLREYNENPRLARKVNFYGFDVPGSPSNPNVNRGVETAIVEVLKYLDRVDHEAAVGFHARVDCLLPHMRFDLYRPMSGAGYHRLSQGERDTVTAAVADLIALLEQREARYGEASTFDEYQWAYRTSIGARQVDGWLRQIPIGWRASGEQLRFLDVASDLRDRAQADNLEWIVRREGASGKILVYAHNGHLSTTSVKWSWWPLGGTGERRPEVPITYRHEVGGTYLRRRFGDQLFTIGNLIGKGDIGCTTFKQALREAPPDSLDGLAKEVGSPLFLLDLRTAPSGIRHFLNQERRLGRGFTLPGNYDVSLELSVVKGFDALFYVEAVTPACGIDIQEIGT